MTLPVPPLWVVQYADKNAGVRKLRAYHDLETDTTYRFHPALIYAYKLLEQKRLKRASPFQVPEEQEDMTFLDNLYR